MPGQKGVYWLRRLALGTRLTCFCKVLIEPASKGFMAFDRGVLATWQQGQAAGIGRRTTVGNTLAKSFYLGLNVYVESAQTVQNVRLRTLNQGKGRRAWA